jgi:hypothetical protein
MSARTLTRALVLGLGAALLAALGCNREADGLTKTTLFKVKNGMQRPEVTAILGEGTEVEMADIPKLPGMEKFTPPPPELRKVRDDNPANQTPIQQKGGSVPLPPEAPMKDVGSLKWVKYGTDDKYILVGFADDMVFEVRQYGVVPK